MSDTPSLEDQVVLLTGSTGLMGRALTTALLDAGAKLALGVRRMANLPELEELIVAQPDRTMIIPCDLRFEANVVRLVHRVVNRYGRIDAIINAAAILGPQNIIEDYPAEPWRDVIATNVTGPYLVCREALPWMKRQGYGRIVNVTSQSPREPKIGDGAYMIGNCAIEGFTRLLARELKNTNICVNCLDIGRMTTDVTPVAPPAEWLPAFLWLASKDVACSGERISYRDRQ